MNELLSGIHQHALWVAAGFGVLAWIFGKFDSPNEHGSAWIAGLSGLAAVAILIWHLADPWVKDADLVKPLGMIEEVQARLKLNPKDEAAIQAWKMTRDKMAEVDPETRACSFARKNLESDPARAIKGLVPGVDLNKLILDLLTSLEQSESTQQ